ncbi:MAG: hypothetical protein AAGN46_12820 [Acidobacteriota bacterium]
MPKTLRFPVLAVFLLITSALVACGPQDPMTAAIAERQNYDVRLSSWFEKRVEPMTEPATEPVAEQTAEPTEGTDAESPEPAIEEPLAEFEGETPEPAPAPAEPTSPTVVLDLVVIYNGYASLEGLTVEVEHVDAAQNEKATYREYLELGQMANAETRQVTIEVEDVDLAEGDAFSVSVPRVGEGESGEFPELPAG